MKKVNYIDYLYTKFHKESFIFLETKTKEHRSNLFLYTNVQGVFYDYSLDTLKISKAVGICPYECYKIANERFNYSSFYCRFDYKTKIPYVTFDSAESSIRNNFLIYIDYIPSKIKLSEGQKIILQAYRMAISELLNYQDKIDSESSKRKVQRENMAEKNLKEIYREASKLFHPDVNKSVEAEKIMKQVNNYYEKKDYHSIKNLMDKTTHTV